MIHKSDKQDFLFLDQDAGYTDKFGLWKAIKLYVKSYKAVQVWSVQYLP